ncbi:hypothetical protein LZG04_05505 [Saccharothrix sp. S26]|uniref:hypothetical protein n=1 Tax=Saccharothrix sp. S26 TaxID=2907215 RepID=UPI001F1FA2EB|nr:hypothetical protein [Saccharothrix sp. S26]MCE6994273.1 hypothetical protein [Saccharothrix sp. S26]
MVGEDLELLITAVVAADDEQQARAACAALVRQVGGRVVRAIDCSDEEPGCWSVTISRVSGERATQNVAGALARAVRTFVRQLGDEFPTPRVACEPPTAWTVLEDPALLDGLLPGAERLLVEAWAGGDPQQNRPEPEAPGAGGARSAQPPEAERVSTRLSLRVDVATDRSAGAEWQARAVASRVARSGKITRVAPHGHLLSVHLDLGASVNSPTVALRDAVTSLGRSGWSEVEWSGGSGTTRWSAAPVPETGIAALELTATPASAFVWTVPD